MIVTSHLTGNANVKAANYGFMEAGLLTEFYVSFASFPGSVLDKLGNFGPFADIRRRQFHPALRPFTRSWPWLEIGRIIAPKAGLTQLVNEKNALFHIDDVVHNFDRHVASQLSKAMSKGAHAVYGYEDTALASFQQAKRLGLKCIYDLPIGYWRAAQRLLAPERERWPEWASTLNSLQDSEAKLTRKENELLLADAIFVASSFTANTLSDYQGVLPPVRVIPYGFPPVSDVPKAYSSSTGGRPLKVLFVGSLSQRKGIADLFAAVEALKPHVELTVVGSKSTDGCQALNTALTKHRWVPSLPHDKILELMRISDVLAFPSLFEGFGLVITEAMSQGTPVITTDRTIGPDIIEHGVNGWLVEAGSTSALQAALEDILRRPHLVSVVGHQALASARQRPWSVYGRELATAVKDFL
jgi:glycosyltransferase involved in cell wall biosynthesis